MQPAVSSQTVAPSRSVLIGRRAAMIPAADVQQQDVSFTRLHIHLTAGAKRAVINRVI